MTSWRERGGEEVETAGFFAAADAGFAGFTRDLVAGGCPAGGCGPVLVLDRGDGHEPHKENPAAHGDESFLLREMHARSRYKLDRRVLVFLFMKPSKHPTVRRQIGHCGRSGRSFRAISLYLFY